MRLKTQPYQARDTSMGDPVRLRSGVGAKSPTFMSLDRIWNELVRPKVQRFVRLDSNLQGIPVPTKDGTDLMSLDNFIVAS